jgi:uncharacterized protein
MRFLMLLAVLLLGIWLWRTNREVGVKSKTKDKTSKPEPMEMVGCSLCAVHVLISDALQGKKGFYCCQEHRQRAEP